MNVWHFNWLPRVNFHIGAWGVPFIVSIYSKIYCYLPVHHFEHSSLLYLEPLIIYLLIGIILHSWFAKEYDAIIIAIFHVNGIKTLSGYLSICLLKFVMEKSIQRNVTMAWKHNITYGYTITELFLLIIISIFSHWYM